jgi:CII-binding regulator of phage lambda lysogenization HflD
VTQLENQSLALAGMFQVAVLIDALALTGNCDNEAFSGSFDSLFTFEADRRAATSPTMFCRC